MYIPAPSGSVGFLDERVPAPEDVVAARRDAPKAKVTMNVTPSFNYKVESVRSLLFRDGSTADAVMEQLCTTLQQAPRSASSSSPPTSGSVAVRASSLTSEALLLALRGVSLAGESIRAEDASNFKKVREVLQV